MMDPVGASSVVNEQKLAELNEWLEQPPTNTDIMKVLEAKLRATLQLARESGLIPEDEDPTPLVNRAVKKYATDHLDGTAFHVADLNKPDLLTLTQNTYTFLTKLTGATP